MLIRTEGGYHSVNISNAAIFGLKDDLKLGGVEYNTALTIFFVPYICGPSLLVVVSCGLPTD